jgi:hypothetical protein
MNGACIGCTDDSACSPEQPVCGERLDCISCSSDGDCSRFPDRGRCDTATGACVGCLSPSECGGDKPICDTVCRSCIEDTECPLSGVCDYPLAGSAQRACIDETKVIYTAVDGADTNPCTKSEPCRSVQHAVNAADGVRRWVVLGRGNHKSEASLRINAKTVTIIGRLDFPGYIHNSSLSTSGFSLPLIKVEGPSEVTFRSLELKDTNAEGDGVECVGAGGVLPRVTLDQVALSGISGRAVVATSCVVTVSRSRILGGTGGGVVVQGGRLNLLENEVEAGQRGGISVSGASFEIVNNLIFNNGNSDAPFGGVRLSQITSELEARFEYNTVTGNSCTGCQASGVECAEVTAPLVLSNNIVYGNHDEGTAQVGGDENCTWTYSNIGPRGAPAGEGNINLEPMWIDPMRNDFHIQTLSPAVDAADPRSTLSSDVDGEPRPRGKARDMGADEAN